MKFFIIGMTVIVLVLAGYWAGTKKDDEVTPSPSFTSHAPVRTPTATSGLVGNRSGDIAPDFQLNEASGKSFALRDYRGREQVQLTFRVAGQVEFKPASAPQAYTLLDPDDALRRLYAVPSMSYTVLIDEQGIIR